MGKLLAGIGLAVLSVNGCAEVLSGVYGHAFTGKRNDAVWTVQRSTAGIYQVLQHGDDSRMAGKVLDDAARLRFWQKMDWPQATVSVAQCLQFGDDMICHVPQPQRRQIVWLADNRSDYFYYDTMAGVMEVHRIG